VSTVAVPAPGAIVAAHPRTRGTALDYWVLTKPGITRHVVSCAVAGYLLGAAWPPDGWRLAALLGGTALVSGGANTLNQWWERDLDARMPRTRNRPLAAGRIPAGAALRFGLIIATVGVALLAWRLNLLTATLAALSFTSYVLLYTPLKRLTTLNTLVGCVPGALPVLGGWTAATGGLAPAAWALFAVLFLWQLPHTLALAWLHREDYGRAGMAMPGGDDAAGRRTAIKSTLYALALLGASLLPVTLGLGGGAYATVAVVLGSWLVLDGVRWAVRPAPARASRLFVATLVYLPLLLLALVVSRAASG
jgi:protoheme IX farnesyltransferase